MSEHLLRKLAAKLRCFTLDNDQLGTLCAICQIFPKESPDRDTFGGRGAINLRITSHINKEWTPRKPSFRKFNCSRA